MTLSLFTEDDHEDPLYFFYCLGLVISSYIVTQDEILIEH